MPATTAKYDRSWTRWYTFAADLEFGSDPFLDSLECRHRTILICLFASSLREGEFSRENVHGVAKGTVLEAVDEVVSQFRANFRPYLRHDLLG